MKFTHFVSYLVRVLLSIRKRISVRLVKFWCQFFNGWRNFPYIIPYYDLITDVGYCRDARRIFVIIIERSMGPLLLTHTLFPTFLSDIKVTDLWGIWYQTKIYFDIKRSARKLHLHISQKIFPPSDVFS